MGNDIPRRYLHRELAAERWKTLSYEEQMGNIGSEVERAFRALETKDRNRLLNAMARAHELFELTLSDEGWCVTREFEVLRLLEQFREAVADSSQESEIQRCARRRALSRSLLQFAIEARANR